MGGGAAVTVAATAESTVAATPVAAAFVAAIAASTVACVSAVAAVVGVGGPAVGTTTAAPLAVRFARRVIDGFEEFTTDRHGYTSAKSEFIRGIEARARAWAERNRAAPDAP